MKYGVKNGVFGFLMFSVACFIFFNMKTCEPNCFVWTLFPVPLIYGMTSEKSC